MSVQEVTFRLDETGHIFLPCFHFRFGDNFKTFYLNKSRKK